MTRIEFISRLRRALGAFPPATTDEIIADYEAHFAEATAAGRSEAEVAAALGDPNRLARELRMEAGLARWEREKSPSSAAGALVALVGLGAVDILILIPFVLSLYGALFSFALASVAILVAGAVALIAGPFAAPPGGPWAAVLLGFGMMFGAIAFGALTAILTIWLSQAVIWFGRLHYRLLKPVIEANTNNNTQGEPS